MLADCCSHFLEHGPHSGQRQLLEDARWGGETTLDRQKRPVIQ